MYSWIESFLSIVGIKTDIVVIVESSCSSQANVVSGVVYMSLQELFGSNTFPDI